MTLPGPCELCAPYGGNWCEGANGGMARCGCARGKALSSPPPPPRDPMLSTEAAQVFAEHMAAIPFFPASAGAMSAVADEIACLCETPDQAAWLVRRMRRLYAKWPGPAVMRLVYTQKHHPLDGIQATCGCEVYPDGIPSEAETMAALPAAPQKRLPAPKAEDLTAAQSIQKTISALAEAKDLNRTVRTVKVPEIPVNQVTTKTRITQADIDREIAKLRESRDMAIAAEVGI